jgi:hypothetical protein
MDVLHEHRPPLVIADRKLEIGPRFVVRAQDGFAVWVFRPGAGNGVATE